MAKTNPETGYNRKSLKKKLNTDKKAWKKSEADVKKCSSREKKLLRKLGVVVYRTRNTGLQSETECNEICEKIKIVRDKLEALSVELSKKQSIYESEYSNMKRGLK